LKGGNIVANDPKKDRVDPLIEVAGQIMSDCGIPDQIEVLTANGGPVQIHLVYEGGGDAGQGSDRSPTRTGRIYGYSGKRGPKSATYVYLRDRPDESVH